MQTRLYPICDRCDNPILHPDAGVIVRGDVYSAEINEDGKPGAGFIGPSFPMPDSDCQEGDSVKVDVNKVHMHCYCKDCLRSVLGL